MVAATVISVGTSILVPPSFADSTSDISATQTAFANQLKNLELAGIQLDEKFSADILDYHVTVENDRDNVVLHISGNEHQVITINGNTVEDPSNVSLNLKTGVNTFSIVVDDAVDTPVIYTLTIFRKLNGNNLLNNIKLSSGKLSKTFDPNVTDYNVQLPNEEDSLTVSPEVNTSAETVRINGMELKQGSVSVKLPVGKSDITILVTAENGESKKYILHVVRATKMVQTPPVKKPTTNPRYSGGAKNTYPGTQTVQKNTGFMNKGQGTTSIQKTSSQSTGSQVKDDERKTYVLVFDKDVKEKKTEDSLITTSSSTANNSVQTNNSVHTNNNLNTPDRIKYSNPNQMKQSTSWWGRLWSKILSWF